MVSKSVYSVVLMDEVVDEIDKLAYKQGTNRSNMINRILAEYVSCMTPEKRVKQFFEEMNDMFSALEPFMLLSQTNDPRLIVRSQLKYRYRPTVNYSVELYGQPDEEKNVGELKISVRTQNDELLKTLGSFFCLWAKLEMVSADKFPIAMAQDSAHYVKKLPQVSGKAIVSYINSLDTAMKSYFTEDEEHRSKAVIEEYNKLKKVKLK